MTTEPRTLEAIDAEIKRLEPECWYAHAHDDHRRANTLASELDGLRMERRAAEEQDESTNTEGHEIGRLLAVGHYHPVFGPVDAFAETLKALGLNAHSEDEAFIQEIVAGYQAEEKRILR